MKKSFIAAFVFVVGVIVSCAQSDSELSYTASFYDSDGKLYSVQSVSRCGCLSEPEVPDKPTEDSYFLGWFYGDELWDFSYGLAKNIELTARFDLVALKFYSDDAFEITPRFVDDVSMTYSVDDGLTWNLCSDNVKINVDDAIYFRGSGNAIITGADFGNPKRWVITQDDSDCGVFCSGNIETILDYDTVMRGEHPQMGGGCFFLMFGNCSALLSVPDLPSVDLSPMCYFYMFLNCNNLERIPILPIAESYGDMCYFGMFAGCSKLHFVTWSLKTHYFMTTSDDIVQNAGTMLNGETPEPNMKYYYFAQ